MTAVQLRHAHEAHAALRTAMFWSRRGTAPATVRHLATEAGRRMAWAGRLYIELAVGRADVMDTPEVWSAVRDGWFGQQETQSARVRCAELINALAGDPTR